jgi:MoaA/NifB/PqqE/SkfB family radical SAM enzyme
MNILPSYACNFHCPFCAIHQQDCGQLLNLDYAKQQLSSIPGIRQIDILGGEPSLLPDEYLSELIDICTSRLNGKLPGMYTNLSRVSPLIDRVKLTVSFDPGMREARNSVIQNMLMLDNEFDINTIVSSKLVALGAGHIEKMLSRFRMAKRICLSSFTHFPGMPDYTPAPEDMLKFMKDILSLDEPHRIHFSPISSIREGSRKSYAAEESAEMLPSGKYRYALRDVTSAKEFETFDAVKKYRYNNESYPGECNSCRYRGQCLNKYRTEAGCYWDKKIMETIEERLS